MKYNAKQITSGEFKGKYAVFTGKKFWPKTATDNKLEAEQEALIMSMGFYQDQMDNAWNELVASATSYNSLGEPHLENDGENEYTDKGDLMC